MRSSLQGGSSPSDAVSNSFDPEELFEREANDFEDHAQRFLAMARTELPEALGDVVTVQGGVILAAIERLVRVRSLATRGST